MAVCTRISNRNGDGQISYPSSIRDRDGYETLLQGQGWV